MVAHAPAQHMSAASGRIPAPIRNFPQAKNRNVLVTDRTPGIKFSRRSLAKKEPCVLPLAIISGFLWSYEAHPLRLPLLMCIRYTRDTLQEPHLRLEAMNHGAPGKSVCAQYSTRPTSHSIHTSVPRRLVARKVDAVLDA